MSEGLSEAQLDEFEKIIDNDANTINKWLESIGDYKNHDIYKKLVEAAGGESPEVTNDFVTAAWLSQNCPQYEQIINSSINDLRDEIVANKDQILASV
jgi:hypothetical protein